MDSRYGKASRFMSSSYVFTSRSELDDALDDWVSDQVEAVDEYGEISAWDVRAITDFSTFFIDKIFRFRILTQM